VISVQNVETPTFTWTEMLEKCPAEHREFPLIEKGAHGDPAVGVTVEWNGESNETQIVRRQWRNQSGEQSYDDKALIEFLRDVETILWFGEPSRETGTAGVRGFCGGAKYYIGVPHECDTIEIRTLRNPILREIETDQFGIYYDTPIQEWLAEFTLVAVAGDDRESSPRIVPPRHLLGHGEVRAWWEGESLA